MPLLGTVDDPKLPADGVDHVLIIIAYHEFSHPVEMMRHVRKAMKRDGQMLVVEYKAENPDSRVDPLHKMSEAAIMREMSAAGFRRDRVIDIIPSEHVLFSRKQRQNDLRPMSQEVSMLRLLLTTTAVLTLALPATAQDAEVGQEYEITIATEEDNQYTGPYGQAKIGSIVIDVPNAKAEERYTVRITNIAQNQYSGDRQAPCEFEQIDGTERVCVSRPRRSSCASGIDGAGSPALDA